MTPQHSKLIISVKGNKRSGFHGHAGRRGKRGGSQARTESEMIYPPKYIGFRGASDRIIRKLVEDEGRYAEGISNVTLAGAGVPLKPGYSTDAHGHINFTDETSEEPYNGMAWAYYDPSDQSMAIAPSLFANKSPWFVKYVITHEIGHHATRNMASEVIAKLNRACEKMQSWPKGDLVQHGIRPSSISMPEELAADLYYSLSSTTKPHRREGAEALMKLLGLTLKDLTGV